MNDDPQDMYRTLPDPVSVTVTAPVQKRCPYRDEMDEGTVTLTFRVLSGDAPELHALARELAVTLNDPISHEEYTRSLWGRWFNKGVTRIRTTWRTAGLEVTCEVPDRRV